MCDLLAQTEWWFLENLHYLNGILEVQIAEGITSESSEDVQIANGLSINGVRPIQVTSCSRRVRIRFSKVLAYQLMDESYDSQNRGEIKKLGGSVLCQHTASGYTEYLRDSSLINALLDETTHHYSLNLADDILDVVTTMEPTLESL